MDSIKRSFPNFHIYQIERVDHAISVHSRVKRKGLSLECVRCKIKATHAVIYRALGEPDDVRHTDVFGKSANYKHGWVFMTIDHILPKSRGGNNKSSNMQTMCNRCNNKKNNGVSKDELLRIINNLGDHFGNNDKTHLLLPYIYGSYSELVNYDVFDKIYDQAKELMDSKKFMLFEKQMINYIDKANKKGIITSYYQRSLA